MDEKTLTDELTHQIVTGIRAGSFGHVAARARGVPRRLYRRWLRVGRAADAPELYARFAREVDTAIAQARLRAEVAAYKKDARAWLTHGPGREKAGDPGWTGLARPASADAGSASAAPAAHNPFELPGFTDLCRRLLESLADFPEARARAAEALLAAQEDNDTAPGKRIRRRDPHEENTPWSASEIGLDPAGSSTAACGRTADAASAAATTTTSPRAAPAAEPG